MRKSSLRDINATRTIASVLGVFAGLSGLDHGLFEVLQGNVPTPGLVVRAIGPSQRLWVYGTEEAFTLVPSFLATGILAIVVGVAIIVWSIGYIDRRNGSSVFLLLGTLLFLVGGGVAQVGFVVLCFAVSRCIGRPRQGFLPPPAGRTLAKLWLWGLVASTVLGIVALEIAITGFVPGVSDPTEARLICWSSLAVMLVLLLLAILGGFAHDIDRQADSGTLPGGAQ